MAQLSNPGKWTDGYADRPFDGASKLSPHLMRKLGNLGPGFPELRKVHLPYLPKHASATSASCGSPMRWAHQACFPFRTQKVDTADSEAHAVKSVQKYLRDNKINGIANQMTIVVALRGEEVLTDRIYYCLHQLVAGNAGTKDLKDPFGPHSQPK